MGHIAEPFQQVLHSKTHDMRSLGPQPYLHLYPRIVEAFVTDRAS